MLEKIEHLVEIIDDIEFLEKYLPRLRYAEREGVEVWPESFQYGAEEFPRTPPEAERAARLADKNGLDGNMFRELHADYEFNCLDKLRRIRKRIQLIPKIIVQLEQPPRKDSLLLGIPEMALVLDWGESKVREKNVLGLLPQPAWDTGKLQWNKKEVLAWIDAGCPGREAWQRLWKKET
jgi:hypothetical protein